MKKEFKSSKRYQLFALSTLLKKDLIRPFLFKEKGIYISKEGICIRERMLNNWKKPIKILREENNEYFGEILLISFKGRPKEAYHIPKEFVKKEIKLCQD